MYKISQIKEMVTSDNNNFLSTLLIVSLWALVLFVIVQKVSAIEEDQIPSLIYNSVEQGQYLGYHYDPDSKHDLYAWYHNNGNGTFSLEEILTHQEQQKRDLGQ